MEKTITIIPAHSKNHIRQKDILRVAAYCRVSTEQEEQLGSFENQVQYYTKLIAENPKYISAGIFADEGISGTSTKKRNGFLSMMKACRKGEVDLVITKSISRFARNTIDCLRYARELRQLGIPVLFEKENIQTDDASGELLFTILSSLAQEESRNISENTQWGIRSRFKQGIPHLNTNHFLGYDKDEQGNLTINQSQAKTVRRIFTEYMEGYTESEIARHLIKDNIPGITGKAIWPSQTIHRMLVNEKYKGDLLMQKYYTVSFLTKQQAPNTGEYNQYLIKHNHEPIIPEETWNLVQLEQQRRITYKQTHHIRELGTSFDNPYFSRLFCHTCHKQYMRKYNHDTNTIFYQCPQCKDQITLATLHSTITTSFQQHTIQPKQQPLEAYYTNKLQQLQQLPPEEIIHHIRQFLSCITIDQQTITIQYLNNECDILPRIR